MKRLNIQLSDVEKDNIEQAALSLERSMNDCIREAIRQWLENHKKG